MDKVIVAGGGAAGMMAAIAAAGNGRRVTLIEKNEKLGKKLFITGKGRCNFTNAGDAEELLNSIVTNKKFLYSAFSRFSNYDCMGFFDELGLKFKIERGNRVFPESDHASDVIGVLTRQLKKLRVEVLLNTEVAAVNTQNQRFESVTLRDGSRIFADALVIATGGNSYQSTGSTGDGYRFAKSLGHSVTPILPALVPFAAKEEWVRSLQGLSLKNVKIQVFDQDKLLYSDFGEMLFTHTGVSGPVILSASSYTTAAAKKGPLTLQIDLKPALDREQLDNRLLRDFEEQKNKAFKNALDKLLPQKLIPVIIALSGIDPEKRVHEITKEERNTLLEQIKGLRLTLKATMGFGEAIVTQGGIDVKEVNPSTMESKLVSNVYFAGEVLDVDALTGGFNLQIAWATGWLAGQCKTQKS